MHYAGLILGRCGLPKNGGEGVTLSKTHHFRPFVNSIMVILLNFLDFVIFPSFFLDFCQIVVFVVVVVVLFLFVFLGGAPHLLHTRLHKLLTVQIKLGVHHEEQPHLPLILIPNL